MADQVLALVYNTTTGRVTGTGLTNGINAAVASILTKLGISWRVGETNGRLIDKSKWTKTAVRGNFIATFNGFFDQDPNPYNDNETRDATTDNITVTLTST